jgi:hypothetical protein
MPGDAIEPSGRCRLLVAGRPVLPPLLDGGADSGIQPGQRAAPSASTSTTRRLDPKLRTTPQLAGHKRDRAARRDALDQQQPAMNG